MTAETYSDAPAHSVVRATSRLGPPAVPLPFLRRERLLARLRESLERRLTIVVADAGFGKSTLLAGWAEEVHCAWYTAAPEDASFVAFSHGIGGALRLRVPALALDAAATAIASAGPRDDLDEPARARGFAAAACEALRTGLQRDLVLVIDDVHEIAGSPGAIQVIESLCRQAPRQLHVVLVSRFELPFAVERLRGQGHVVELASTDLAFDVDEVGELLERLVGPADAETATRLVRLTNGWPAATRLAIEALRGVAPDERVQALERIRLPHGSLVAYLAAEVFTHEGSEVEELVTRVAPLERFTPALCEALGMANAGPVARSLARRGLFVELSGNGSDWYTLSAPVREFALAQRALSEAETRALRRAAAQWFREHDEPEEALRCLVAVEDSGAISGLLADSGRMLLARGSVDTVLEGIVQLDPAHRSPEHELLAGDAFQLRGDWEAALSCFDRAAGGSTVLAPGLAWRIGRLYHLAGRLDDAFAAYDRGILNGEPRDVALLLAWRAAARWLRGDRPALAADAERALEVATEAGDPAALAASHTALAMLAALDGDRGANDFHYLRSLAYATDAGDVGQLIRIHANRGSQHVEEGAYDAAIAELDLALRLADIAGFGAFRALALTNRGDALARLGRFDEAAVDLETATGLYRRLSSRLIAYPLGKLGRVYRLRGQYERARGAYEEAITHAEAAGDRQGLLPALAGLARVVVGDDVTEASALVERALDMSHDLHDVEALVAAGLVALARGDRDRASTFARQGVARARARRDPNGLAESLELGALAAPPRADDKRLDEAIALYQELRNPVGEGRATLVRALLAGDVAEAHRTDERLRALGARGYLATLSTFVPLAAENIIVVQSLGRFRVLRGGSPVPLTAWRSRKARDLFKMLVARRGRPVQRELLMEWLWPGHAPGPLPNRLSVLLSTVRTVLDPDRSHESDHYVAAERSTLRLEVDRVVVDVEEFLVGAAAALAARRAGHPEALERLAAAEAAYTGDFLEEDVYEEWAIPIREECRAAYTEIVRTLAEAAGARGDVEPATRYYLRILERDPYDEPAHLGLVLMLETAGRHGAARRSFQAYCNRMDEIGVESAPFPSVERRSTRF